MKESNRLAKQVAPRRKSSKRRLSLQRTRSHRLPPEKNVPDTYNAWLETQQRLRLAKTKRKPVHTENMPTDTLQAWLEKQPVKEKEAREEVTPPLGSTEEWLRKQISDRLARDKAEQEVSFVVTK